MHSNRLLSVLENKNQLIERKTLRQDFKIFNLRSKYHKDLQLFQLVIHFDNQAAPVFTRRKYKEDSQGLYDVIRELIDRKRILSVPKKIHFIYLSDKGFENPELVIEFTVSRNSKNFEYINNEINNFATKRTLNEDALNLALERMSETHSREEVQNIFDQCNYFTALNGAVNRS